MTEETGPFRLEAAYEKRLIAAAVTVAVAAFTLHMLLNGGAGTHWVLAIVIISVSASAAAMLTLVCVERWHQIRRLGVITEAPKLYGYAGPEPAQSAVDNLKRPRKTAPKSVH